MFRPLTSPVPVEIDPKSLVVSPLVLPLLEDEFELLLVEELLDEFEFVEVVEVVDEPTPEEIVLTG